jgi:hypothetical protein
MPVITPEVAQTLKTLEARMAEILITVPHEAERFVRWSAHRVTLGVTRGDEQHYGGDGRELGYVSGGMIESAKNPHPLTRVWVHLNVDELAKLPEVRAAVAAHVSAVDA